MITPFETRCNNRSQTATLSKQQWHLTCLNHRNYSCAQLFCDILPSQTVSYIICLFVSQPLVVVASPLVWLQHWFVLVASSFLCVTLPFCWQHHPFFGLHNSFFGCITILFGLHNSFCGCITFCLIA